jgi:phosphate transport system permease protein
MRPGAGRRAWRRTVERTVEVGLVLCGLLSIFTTFSIIGILLEETRRFFTMPDVTPGEFFGTMRWAPLLGNDKHFGIWPLIAGTGLVSGVAALFALPLGLITAIFLSEYAPRRLRMVLKPVLEVLAGIPTVVYGYFALTVITPALKFLLGDQNVESYNALSAGLAVGIMIFPIVCSLSEDALRAVPRSLREGAYACGATKFDVSCKVVVPAALSGVIASYLLAIARATGETMIVALAAGNLPPDLSTWEGWKQGLNPAHQTQTMTGYMVQIFLGDTASLGVEYYSSYAVAFMLFLLTMVLTLMGHYTNKKFREVYE